MTQSTDDMRILLHLLLLLQPVTSFKCPETLTRICKCSSEQRFVLGRREVLRYVDCSSRGLLNVPYLDFPPNTRLHELRLQNNSITSLSSADVGARIKIHKVDISGNPLAKSLTTGLFNRIATGISVLIAREIRLDLQNLTALNFLRGVDSLTVLDLSRNFVHGVDKLPNLFSELSFPSLSKLSLSLCRIHKVNVHAFVGLDNLEDVDLSRNHLIKVPRALSRLKSLLKLNLRENDITVIYHGDFSELTSLRELDLSRNLLGQRESFRNGALFGIRNSLTHLYLQAVQLEVIPTSTLSDLKFLQHLDISRNRISVMRNTSFSGRYKLTSLDISYNPWNIDREMFAGVQNSLLNLKMHKTGLKTIPLVPLQRLSVLRELDLSFNSLLAIDTLDKISARRLIFHENRIRFISPHAFSHYKRPVDLDVSRNILGSLDFVFKSDHCTFYKLNISGNGFLCDCNVEKLINSGRTRILAGDCLQKNGNSVSFRNETMVKELEFQCGKSSFTYCFWWIPKSSANSLTFIRERDILLTFLSLCFVLTIT